MDIRYIPIVSLYLFVMSQGINYLSMLTLNRGQACKTLKHIQ